MTSYLIYYLIVINLVGLIIMKVDKQKAIKHQYRISERTLWIDCHHRWSSWNHIRNEFFQT